MNINLTKKKIFLSFVLAIAFFAFIFFIFPEKSSAASVNCVCGDDSAAQTGDPSYQPDEETRGLYSSEETCRNSCKEKGYPVYMVKGGTWTPTETSEERNEREGQSRNDVENEDGIFLGAIKLILIAVLKLVGILLTLSGVVFAWAADAKNIQFVLGSSALYEAWGYVRDVLNVFFILVLLFSAFSTIFQIEKYNYKKILVTLIIMALLVNFSFPLVRIIIDFSNVIMYSLLKAFLPVQNDASEIFVDISRGSEINKILSPEDPSFTFLLSAIVFVFILAITLLALAALLVIRIMALAILIIFSPVGFIGIIIPGISSQVSKFWDNLLRFSFFGPIMVFMLVISAKIMSSINRFDFGSGSNGTSFQKAANVNSIDPSIIASMSVFIIPIIILWMGMGVASSMSIAGANIITSKTRQWGKKLTLGLAGTGLKALGRKVDRDLAAGKYGTGRVGKYFSPTAFKEGWKQRRQELEEKAFAPAIGGWRDTLNKRFNIKAGLGEAGETTRYGEAGLQANILKKQKEVGDVSQDSGYLSGELANAVRARDSQKAAAVLRILYGNNDQNEMIKELDDETKVLYGLVDENGNPLKDFDVNPKNKKMMLQNVLSRAGMSQGDIGKQLYDLGEIGFSKGNFTDYGMAMFDTKTKSYKITDMKTQQKAMLGKASNIESQSKMKLLHWNTLFEEKEGGGVGDLHEFGKTFLSKVTASEIGQMNRARQDFINNAYEKVDQIDKYADQLEKNGLSTPGQIKLMRDFAKAIRTNKEQGKK